MSNTMTSDPYGIKVKEKKDHIPFGGIILRYIGGADKPWTVQANTDSLWYNGKEYNTGSTILSFKEGTDNKGLPFMIGEPKEDPETGIISWYFYRITGLYSKPFTPIPDEYDPGVPDPPEPTPPAGPLCTYTVRRYGDGPVITSSLIEIKKFVDGVEVGSKRIGKKDIQNYKIAHSSNYWNCIRVFRNLLVDWSDHIEVGPSLYESGYVLISDIDYLEYNGATYQKKNTIASWPQYEDVQIDITDWSTYEPTKMENNYKKIQVSSKKGAPSTVIFSKIDGNVVAATKEVTLAELQAYKASHDNKPMKIFENILFDYSYRFLVISNSEYLRYEEFPKYSGEVIEAWYINEYVDFEVYDYSLNYENTMEKDDIYVVQLEYLKYESDPYGHGYYTNPDVKDPDDPTKSLPNPWKVTKDKVYYDVCWDHLEMYYNGHYHDAAWLVYDNPNEGHKKFGKIAISYCEPFWVLITCVDGVVWNGTAYKGKKLLKMWKKDEAVNLTMSYKKYRKVQSSAKKKDFDEIKYIIETAESNNTITVEKRINDLVDDTIVFDPETDCPVTFHTIRFGFQNGKINLYANGDYVRLGSTSYRKNKLMTSWELSEKVYFAVTDISNQYEVEKTITYEIKTEQVTVTDFEVETNPDKSVSLYKMIYGEPSGEETVRYYDAMYDGGYVYEKLLISFDPAPMMWSLISQSDDIYIENVNYPNGTIIATWAYGESFQLSGIGHITDSDSQIRLTSTEVDSKKSYETEIEHVTYPEFSIVTQSNYSLNVTNDQAGSTPTTINIRSFDAPVLFYGLKFLYDSTYGGWILKSDRDDIYYNGENYKKGKEISKWLYHDEVDLTVDSWVEDIKHTTRLDKIKNLVVSTTDGWLYGYIWMKFPQPGPTPSQDPDIIIYVQYASYSSGSGERGRLLGITNSANFTVQTLIDRTGSSSNYPSIRYAKGNRLYINPLYYTDDFGHTAMKSMTPQFSPVYNVNRFPVDFDMTSQGVDVVVAGIILDKYKYAFVITGSDYDYEDVLQIYEVDLLGRLNKISEEILYDFESKPVNNLINQITSGSNNNFDYYFGAAFSKSGYRPDPYYGPVLISWTEYSILNKNFQSVADNPFDSVFGSLYDQYHVFDHYNPWIVDPQGNPVPVYEGVEFSQSQSISGYGWTDLKEQTQWHHYNQSNTQDEEDEIVPRTMYTTIGIMYNSFHLRRRYYEQTSATGWRTLYQDLGWYYSIYDVNTGICSVNAYSYDYSDMQRALDIIGRAKLFKGDAYSFEIVDDELHILQVSRSNPFIWQVVKSKDVGSTVNLKLYTNRSGDSTFVTITLGVNQLYNSSNRTCGIIPFDTAVGAVHSGSNGGAINTDNYWRYRVRIDGYQNKYINLVFDNPYFDGGGLGFAFLDDI